MLMPRFDSSLSWNSIITIITVIVGFAGSWALFDYRLSEVEQLARSTFIDTSSLVRRADASDLKIQVLQGVTDDYRSNQQKIVELLQSIREDVALLKAQQLQNQKQLDRN